MLWEETPLEETRKRLTDQFRVRSVVFDPCGNQPETGDYLTVMRSNVEALEALPAS